MTQQTMPSPAADMAGFGLSTLCVVHCLALPLLAATLPVAGAIAEMEAVHKGLVAFAGATAALAIFQGPARVRLLFGGLAVPGVAILAAGAFVEAFHDLETPLTVVGAVVLAGAHILRWRMVRLGEHHTQV